MPLVDDDIVFKYSGGPGASSAPASLGGFVSTTPVVGEANNIFDDITGQRNFAEATDYRCLFVHNTSTINFANVVIYIVQKTTNGAVIQIGADPIGPKSVTDSAVQAQIVSTPSTAPTGVTFSVPTSSQSAVVLGNINAGQCAGFWIKRVAQNSAPLPTDSVLFRVSGTTIY